jgi:hypothetical protein
LERVGDDLRDDATAGAGQPVHHRARHAPPPGRDGAEAAGGRCTSCGGGPQRPPELEGRASIGRGKGRIGSRRAGREASCRLQVASALALSSGGRRVCSEIFHASLSQLVYPLAGPLD